MNRETKIFLSVMFVVAFALVIATHIPIQAQQKQPQSSAPAVVSKPLPKVAAGRTTNTIVDASATMELTFSWDQPSTDFPNLASWTLYMRQTPGGASEQNISVPYSGGSGPFTSSQSFTVSGAPGSVIKKFFVLDAVSKNGNHSGFSNEISYDFQIPFLDVTVPINLTVTVVVKTN